jgi:hypothetical protein
MKFLLLSFIISIRQASIMQAKLLKQKNLFFLVFSLFLFFSYNCYGASKQNKSKDSKKKETPYKTSMISAAVGSSGVFGLIVIKMKEFVDKHRLAKKVKDTLSGEGETPMGLEHTITHKKDDHPDNTHHKEENLDNIVAINTTQDETVIMGETHHFI